MRSVGVLVLLSASAVASATPTPAPRSAPADATLRAADWCNRTYGDLGPTLIDCRGERDERHRAGDGIWGFAKYHLASVAYGDLTGDGHEDALLLLEVSVEPVLIQKTPPAVHGEMWVITREGDQLLGYTTEDSDTPPTRATIADGVATLVWDGHGARCTERWQFGKVGESAVKSPRQCRH